VTPTEQYIKRLTHLKTGDLGLLRTHAGQELDEKVEGFDLFTGLWWPLRQRNSRAPRRDVAWLVAKLYAFRPLEYSAEETLAFLLGQCQPEVGKREKFIQRFDRMLTLPIRKIEPALQWALDVLNSKGMGLDWIKLTDDLSVWERESTRLEWAKEFLKSLGGG
jgi:CRISPR type I-E-associated protein CasB/Cse2